MQESTKKLVILAVHYYEEDDNPESDIVNKIIPCEDDATADAFEVYFRNKYPDTQLCDIYRKTSSIYKL